MKLGIGYSDGYTIIVIILSLSPDDGVETLALVGNSRQNSLT